ncbi:MAG: HNH endonuclease family protein [Alphaproteobacteria bacterium]
MKINKQPYPLQSLSAEGEGGIRERINTKPDYQRPPVWNNSQKKLLIDTILWGYDIPKIYWRQPDMSKEEYEVVDGQQRLRAIWSYFDGKYALPDNADNIDGVSVAGLKYKDLPDKLKLKINTYNIDIVTMQDSDDAECREMFLRLQNGTSLKAQEVRNAKSGNMRNFIKDLIKHEFFSRLPFKDVRYTFDSIAAQIICLEMEGKPTNIKKKNLDDMYDDNKNFDLNGEIAKSVKRNLNYLANMFSKKSPELEKYNIIALYCVLMELQYEEFVLKDILDKLYNWFIFFEKERRDQHKLHEDEADVEWANYQISIGSSTDSSISIQHRTDFMLRHLHNYFPNLKRKDKNRIFSYSQRITIFRRDKETCQIKKTCNGEKLNWDNWHCDHKIAYSNGGETTVENGQVACVVCNQAKSAN